MAEPAAGELREVASDTKPIRRKEPTLDSAAEIPRPSPNCKKESESWTSEVAQGLTRFSLRGK
jgi:hypothetical protein